MSGSMIDLGNDGGNLSCAGLISNFILLRLIREWDLTMMNMSNPYTLVCNQNLFL